MITMKKMQSELPLYTPRENKIAENFIYTTLRIVAKTNAGNNYGTGFIYDFRNVNDSAHFPFIVTNKHVVKDNESIEFVMHEGKLTDPDNFVPINSHIPVVLNRSEQNVLNHPSDEVDLCAIALVPALNKIEKEGRNAWYRTFDFSFLPTEEELRMISVGEDVLMAGYPIGLWDEVNNLPILRRGIAASLPSSDFKGKSWSAVDIAVFPGSSGSPLIIKIPSGPNPRLGIITEHKAKLLGVLFGGPVHNAEGEVSVVEIPTAAKAVSFTKTMIHLGYCVKSKEINELEKLLDKTAIGN